MRAEIIAALKRIYFNPPKDASMAEVMADAVLAIVEKHK